MKRIALVALAFALAPVSAFADDTPPAGPPPADGPGAMGAPSPERIAAMRQTREQLRLLHNQTRTQVIASLTPQHRAQLATLIGQFAVTPNADRRALVRSIDAILSRNEAQSVVNLVSSERANARSVMEAERAQFESTLSADQRAAMAARSQRMESMRAETTHAPRPIDAGRELLRSLVGEDEREGGPGGPGGFMRGARSAP
jgi:Spy/CpxP family protein refolding chaperone